MRIILVTAELKTLFPKMVIDVPQEVCNREEFIPYLKETLIKRINQQVLDEFIDIQFELGDKIATNK